MQITFYGFLQMIVGEMHVDFPLVESSNLATAWEQIIAVYPKLSQKELLIPPRLVVNNHFIAPEDWHKTSITNTDYLEVFTKVASG